MVYQASTSVQTGSLEEGFKVTWHFQTYWDALDRVLPAVPALAAVRRHRHVLCLLLGYPLAYLIAFKAGRWRNLLLVLVIAPFFTSFLIRTLAWKTILADGGPVVDVLNSAARPGRHQLARHDRGQPGAGHPARGGLRSDVQLPAVHDPAALHLAGADRRRGSTRRPATCTPSPSTTFRKVTFPLSMPGVVSGTLLTFIPASGDYVNAELLGSTDTKMVGNVIQSQFLRVLDYPTAAALSFILMAVVLVMVTVYIRRSGTEDLV